MTCYCAEKRWRHHNARVFQMSGQSPQGGQYQGLIDMINGGGAGASGAEFQGGGLVSLIANALFDPLGSRQRQNAMAGIRPVARPLIETDQRASIAPQFSPRPVARPETQGPPAPPTDPRRGVFPTGAQYSGDAFSRPQMSDPRQAQFPTGAQYSGQAFAQPVFSDPRRGTFSTGSQYTDATLPPMQGPQNMPSFPALPPNTTVDGIADWALSTYPPEVIDRVASDPNGLRNLVEQYLQSLNKPMATPTQGPR